MKYFFYLAIGATFLLAACNKDDNNDPENPTIKDDNKDYLEDAAITDFFPLEVGNWWKYEVKKYKLEEGPEHMETVGEETISIASVTESGGHQYFVQDCSDQKDQIPRLIRVDGKQIQTNSFTFLSLYLGKAIASGAVDNYGNQSVAVRRHDGTVETPAGTFGKLVNRDTQFASSQSEKPSLQLTDLYSKGVGRVYFEDIDVEGCLCNGGTPVIYTYTLVEYNVQ